MPIVNIVEFKRNPGLLVLLCFACYLLGTEGSKGNTNDSFNQIENDYTDVKPSEAVARLGTFRFVHLDVMQATFSQDMTFVASVGLDSVTRIWEFPSGKLVRALKGQRSILSVAFSADGNLLATGSRDGSVFLWDVHSGALIHKCLENRMAVEKVGFSANGKYVCMMNLLGGIQRWNWNGGDVKTVYAAKNTDAMGFAVSFDFQCLANIESEGTIRIIDFEAKSENHISSKKDSIVSIALSSKGELLGCGSMDGTIRIRKRDGTVLLDGLKNESCPNMLVFSHDAKMLAVAFMDGKVKVYDVNSGRQINVLQMQRDPIKSAAFSSDGKTIVMAGNDFVWLWNVRGIGDIAMNRGHAGGVNAAVFSSDRKSVVTGGEDGIIKIWSLANAQVFKKLIGHEGGVNSVLFLPDGTLASGGSDGKIKLWRLVDGKQIQSWSAHLGGVNDMSIIPGNKYLASAGGDGKIRCWDLKRNGQEVLVLGDTGGSVNSISFSLNDKMMASGDNDLPADGDPCIRLWDIQSRKMSYTFSIGKIGHVYSVSLSPDGSCLAWGYKAIKVKDLQRNVDVPGFLCEEMTHIVRFSPNGRILASGGKDGGIHLWELATGKEISVFHGHMSAVSSISFSLTGDFLVSGSRDTTCLIWSLQTSVGKQLWPGKSSPDTVDELWNFLKTNDARIGWKAIMTMADTPSVTTRFLKARLRPVARLDDEAVARLLDDLGSGVYSVRNSSFNELTKIGQPVLPSLRRALANANSLEGKMRLERLITGLNNPYPYAGEMLRDLRAITALERIGTPDALEVLETLSNGDPAASKTIESKAAIERIRGK